MSEIPHRSEAEQAAIRNEAYRLWEEAGRSDHLELEFWLNAEAKLQAENKISIKPIALPIVITFTAANPAPIWPQAKIICPVPGLTTDIRFFELASTEQQYTSPTPQLNLNPGLLAHDYRLTLLQAAAAAAAFDRIARLIEWFADQDKPRAPLLFQYPHDYSFYLAPEYFWALFQPQTYGDKIAEIDRVLGNYPYASAVTFDLELISLGSNVTLTGRLKAASQAAVFAALSFLGSPAPTAAVGPVVRTVAATAAPVEAPVAASWLAKAAVEGLVGGFTEGLVGGLIHEGKGLSSHEAPSERHPYESLQQEYRRNSFAEMRVPGKGVKAVQGALKQLGLYDGKIDGDLGPMTRRGLDIFVARHPPLVNDYPGGTATIAVLANDVSMMMPWQVSKRP